MSRSITVTMQAEVEARITKPGYLVELLFSNPVRLSTRGDLIGVIGADWEGYDVRVSGISVQGVNANDKPSLVFANADLAMSALVLGEGAVGRGVSVWQFYGDTPSDDEVVQVFYGVCVGARIAASRQVTLACGTRGSTVLRSPRRWINREEGFSLLPPRGAKITFNGQIFEATPED